MNRLVLGLVFIAVVVATLGYYGKSLTRAQGRVRPSAFSPTGVELTSFFEGLPVDSQFRNGRNAFMSIPVQTCEKPSWHSKFGLWAEALLGTTVHAQAQCSNCYQHTTNHPCGTGCGSNELAVAEGGGDRCITGTQDLGTSDCDSACNLKNVTTCTNTGCSGQPGCTCEENNGCSGYDNNGYPIYNPDPCKYPSGCPTDWTQQGSCCVKDGSPIVIDISGDGFVLTDARNGVIFDLDKSGNKQRWSWTAPKVSNGWLVLDRDGNGLIDSGAELFGNFTSQPTSPDPNGFNALAVYDQKQNGGNGDGQIDSKDAIYKSLMIWIDRNHDGISQHGELYHLADLGVETISLDYHLSKQTDEYGNVFRYKSKIKIKNLPDDHWTYDVLLRRARPS